MFTVLSKNPDDVDTTRDLSKGYRFSKYPVVLCVLVVWIIWLIMMFHGQHWKYFPDNWFMTVTMILGSFIAGATSEGGGAVAFPVMTLIFEISPQVARDFSLMIQSVGMIAASFTIYCLKIKVEWRVVGVASIGGAIGMIFGLEYLYQFVKPVYAKCFFVSLWLGFGLALYLIYASRNHCVVNKISCFDCHCYILFLFFGALGGIISSTVGSGIDVLIFSILTLLFRVNPKVSTPTSVVLMGVNALVGFIWKWKFSDQALAEAAWGYWYVCVPVVVIGAPAGTWFVKRCSEKFVVRFLCLSILVQAISAMFILPLTLDLIVISLVVFFTSGIIFYLIYLFGKLRVKNSNVSF